jgi:hypothetical protein
MKHLTILLVLLSATTIFAQDNESAKKDIESVITKSYIEPLYLYGDLEKIKEGFHEEFRMNVLYNGVYSIRTRDEWIERLRNNSLAGNAVKKTYTWEFNLIDVEDQTAVVKLTINEEGKLKYIDYLTLYKFENGWRVITKQFSMY